jgi:hypothetical protein
MNFSHGYLLRCNDSTELLRRWQCLSLFSSMGAIPSGTLPLVCRNARRWAGSKLSSLVKELPKISYAAMRVRKR